jgi:hypothetical protein
MRIFQLGGDSATTMRVLRGEDSAAECSYCRLVALVPDRTRCGLHPPLTEGIHGCTEEEMGLT